MRKKAASTYRKSKRKSHPHSRMLARVKEDIRKNTKDKEDEKNTK